MEKNIYFIIYVFEYWSLSVFLSLVSVLCVVCVCLESIHTHIIIWKRIYENDSPQYYPIKQDSLRVNNSFHCGMENLYEFAYTAIGYCKVVADDMKSRRMSLVTSVFISILIVLSSILTKVSTYSQRTQSFAGIHGKYSPAIDNVFAHENIVR